MKSRYVYLCWLVVHLMTMPLKANSSVVPQKRGEWSKEEDRILSSLMQGGSRCLDASLAQEFSQLSKEGSRNFHQCYRRWYNNLNPAIKLTGPLTGEEKQLIILRREKRIKFATIAQELGRRVKTIQEFYSLHKQISAIVSSQKSSSKVLRRKRNREGAREELSKLGDMVAAMGGLSFEQSHEGQVPESACSVKTPEPPRPEKLECFTPKPFEDHGSMFLVDPQEARSPHPCSPSLKNLLYQVYLCSPRPLG